MTCQKTRKKTQRENSHHKTFVLKWCLHIWLNIIFCLRHIKYIIREYNFGFSRTVIVIGILYRCRVRPMQLGVSHVGTVRPPCTGLEGRERICPAIYVVHQGGLHMDWNEAHVVYSVAKFLSFLVPYPSRTTKTGTSSTARFDNILGSTWFCPVWLFMAQDATLRGAGLGKRFWVNSGCKVTSKGWFDRRILWFLW